MGEFGPIICSDCQACEKIGQCVCIDNIPTRYISCSAGCVRDRFSRDRFVDTMGK